MKVDRTNLYTNNRTYFTALNAKKAEGLLFSRLNSPKRHRIYEILEYQINKLPYPIELSTGKNGKRLQGKIDMPGQKMKQESFFSALFNLSPNRFIKSLLKEAQDLQSTATHLNLINGK